MFDLSWTEILVIGTVAIVFIGPKELPTALRTAGQWAAKARALARDFQGNVQEMIRESEIQDIKNHVEKLGSGDLQRQIEQHLDPNKDISSAFSTPNFSLSSDAPPPAVSPPAPTPAEPPATQKPAA